MRKKESTYTDLKQALASFPRLPQTLNILDVGCLHAVYNKQLRDAFATAQLKKGKRTVHIVACDLPSLKHIKKGNGAVKQWKHTHKHTEVLVLQHHNRVRNVHQKTTKKHLQKKHSYDIIFSIRPDNKNQQQWLDTLAVAWKHHKKATGIMLLYMADIKGKTAQQNNFIEKLKKKCNAAVIKKINARIPLSKAKLVVLK